MGSYNVSCGFSNLGINEGDATGFLILEKKPDYKIHDFPEPGSALTINATDLYRPFLPAVYGVYNDYGSIGNIKETTTTKILEEIFHRAIEVIVECICEDRDIYYKRGAIARNYQTVELPDPYSSSGSLEDELLRLGFTKNEANGRELYDFHGYSIYLSENGSAWNILHRNSDRIVGSIPSRLKIDDFLNTFGGYTGTYPGFSSEDFSAIKKLHRFSGMFFLEEVAVKMDKFANADHYMNNLWKMQTQRFQGDWEEMLSDLHDPENEGRDAYSIMTTNQGFDLFVRNLALGSEHIGKLEQYRENPAELFGLRTMIHLAEDLNRPFGPSVYVSIGDGDRAAKMLNMVSADILRKRQEEWEEENFDPEEDDPEDNYWLMPDIS